MGGTQSSSTTSSVAATNPALQKLFTGLFGGGGGGGGLAYGAADTLQGLMKGSVLSQNVNQLYGTQQKATQPQFLQGQAQIREQMGRAGLTNSTALSGALGNYQAQYLGNLSQTATAMGLQEEQVQQGVAGNLMSMLASAGSQYFTDKSSTSVSMPWTSGFSAIMSGLTGLVGAGTGAGAWGDLLSKAPG